MDSQVSSEVNEKDGGLPWEIWMMVADMIPETSKLTLYILTKVCRTFSQIFSPRLYRRSALVVNSEVKDEIPVPSLLTYVRDLEIVALKYPLNTSNLKRYLHAMVGLRSLHLYDYFTSDEDREQFFSLEDESILQILKRKTPEITEVYMTMSKDGLINMWRNEDAWGKDSVSLLRIGLSVKGFCNLSSLELYCLRGMVTDTLGNRSAEMIDLIDILDASPRLITLGLGLRANQGCEWEDKMLKIHHKQTTFLAVLCERYGRKPGTSPLPLIHLRFGPGVLLWDTPDSVLKMLFTTERLETLHLYTSKIEIETNGRKRYTFNTFKDFYSMNDCPLLRQLWVSDFTTNLVHWIGAGQSQSLIDLIFTEVSSQRHGCRSCLRDALVSNTYLSSRISLYHFQDYANLLLFPDYTYLSNISSLSGKLNFDRYWFDFLVRLGHAPKLTYLSLEPELAQIYYPSFAWSYARNPKPITQHYARFMAAACSSLEFIQIGSWAWKVKRLEKEVETTKLNWKVTIEELDVEEKSAIYLLNLPDLIRRSPLAAYC
ncbi:hypothetical protein BPAE_0132g00230 [Botrytis paeoniae]|uniref:F-box domain-containing protein n=1 Tax=Botrytis paeoniae TaxID=278948 RepID=A0A4Z1FLG5_9HELO|nr:hypothetical protein BPAE_0132g00230 [Botrytis paeoniae]